MASSVGPDQTARMRRLIWDCVDRKRRKVLFPSRRPILTLTLLQTTICRQYLNNCCRARLRIARYSRNFGVRASGFALKFSRMLYLCNRFTDWLETSYACLPSSKYSLCAIPMLPTCPRSRSNVFEVYVKVFVKFALKFLLILYLCNCFTHYLQTSHGCLSSSIFSFYTPSVWPLCPMSRSNYFEIYYQMPRRARHAGRGHLVLYNVFI